MPGKVAMMMKQYEFTCGQGEHLLEATVTLCGTDIAVIIAGGTRQHIGAVALAEPRKSLAHDGVSATASVLCLTGHKEDLWARSAALEIAASCQATTVVSVGIHIDNATSGDLENFTKNFQQLLADIKATLHNLKC